MSGVATLPRSPFKGLAAFADSSLDALLFFGRERERDVILANLLASRLTVLYGETGVGKSSVLRAAVVRKLREVAPTARVIVHDTWADDPAAALADAWDADEAYVVLDQLEEYFVYHGDADGPGTLLHDLPELLRTNPRVNVLLSLREDALARLDAFKARLPGVFANRLQLQHLDREAARAAIVGPVRRWNELAHEHVAVEPALVDAVLDEVAAGRVELGPAGTAATAATGHEDLIEAPYLQLVLERIWDAEREQGSQTLRVGTLRALGGAEAIVREHVDRALDELAPREKDVAASMFEHLVTPSGTKIAHRAGDLAQYAALPEEAVRPVLGALNRERILRSVDGANGSGERYELFHDVLAEPVLAWRARRELERQRVAAERRHRRLLAVALAAVAAFLVVAGLAIWAVTERSDAQAQARHARAGELEARALQELGVDPRTGVRLALTAAQLEPDGAAESVLRQALIEDRLRSAIALGRPLHGVAVSPDGRLVAAVTAGGEVAVADLRSGRLLRTLRAPGPVGSVGFAGGDLVAARENGSATLWSTRTGRRIEPLRAMLAAQAPDGRLVLVPSRGRLARIAARSRFLRASRDGSLVAAGVPGSDGRVRAWVFGGSGALLHVLPAAGILDVAFSPDGRLVATGSYRGATVVWNPRTGARVRTMHDTSGPVVALAFSPDGKLLATGSQDGAARVFTAATGERLFFFTGHTNPLTAIAWSPDGRVLASASSDRTVRLWGVQHLVEAGSPIAVLAGARDEVTALAYGPGGELVSAADGTLRVWDARPEQALEPLAPTGAPVVAAHWAAGGQVVALSRNGTIRIWDARSRRLLSTLPFHFTALAVSRDGSTVVAGDATGAIQRIAPGRSAVAFPYASTTRIVAVAASPDDRTVASADAHGTVTVSRGLHVWSARVRGRVGDLAFSSSGDELASASTRGVAIWSASGRLLHRLSVRGGVVRLAWSPDGKLLASADAAGTAHVWYASSGRLYRVLRGHRAALTDVVFSPDGKLIATSGADAVGRVWNVDDGRVVHTLRGHFGTVAAIAFSPDGRWLVTAGPISAGLWPTATGRLLFYLRGDTALLTSVSFSPDGRTILSSSRDGSVRTYRCEVCGDLRSLDALARQRLARTR